MRIAYVGLDVVNQATAAAIALMYGMTLHPAHDAQSVPPDVDAVIYDFDHLDTDQRQQLLGRLTARCQATLTAVHTHNVFLEDAVAAMRRLGALVDTACDPTQLLLAVASGADQRQVA